MRAALQKGNAHRRRREAVGRPADGAADRPFAGLYPSRRTCASSPTGSSASCCATATRSSGASIRAIVGTEPDAAGESAELRPAGQRDHRRLRRRAQRLSVPRPRLQDAAHATGRTIMPRTSVATTGTSSTRRPTASADRRHQRRSRRGDARRTRGMKILSVNGLYDLATPFLGAEYEFRHMALEPQIAGQHPLHLLSGGPHDVHRSAFGAAAQGRPRGLLRERDIGKEKGRQNLLRRPFRPLDREFTRSSAEGSPRHICRGGRPRARTRAGRLR